MSVLFRAQQAKHGINDFHEERSNYILTNYIQRCWEKFNKKDEDLQDPKNTQQKKTKKLQLIVSTALIIFSKKIIHI